jgi:hypothetical protein
MVSASLEARREAEAKRRLYAVACTTHALTGSPRSRTGQTVEIYVIVYQRLLRIDTISCQSRF